MKVCLIHKAVSDNKEYFERTGSNQNGYQLQHDRIVRVVDSREKAEAYLEEQEQFYRQNKRFRVIKAEWNILDIYEDHRDGHRVLTRIHVDTREVF